MGTWGYGIKQDDFVCDVMDEFDEHLKQNQNLPQTTEIVLNTYKEGINDPDEGPLFWIALANMQWKYGKVDAAVLEKIKSDFAKDAGMERWQEIGEKEYSKRKQVIADFIELISTENPKPKKLPKFVVRKPIFAAGDCLSIQLKNGLYGAALVLVADHSHIEYGKNLIGALDYMETTEPDLSVFQKRDFLISTHHHWENQPDICWYSNRGFRSEKKRFNLIGNIAITENDPNDGNSYAGWNLLGEQIILQKKWDQTH
jgi:hypothetical protein